MRVVSIVLTSALLVSGCSQIGENVYSKKDFTSQSFQADMSECKRQNSSFLTLQSPAADVKERADDVMIRECMKAKGYAIETGPAWSH
jgi:hypothetical protein